jgi:hypothetical protein
VFLAHFYLAGNAPHNAHRGAPVLATDICHRESVIRLVRRISPFLRTSIRLSQTALSRFLAP